MASSRPPGPRDFTFGIGLVSQLKRDILGFYRRMHEDFGDVVYMRLGPYHDYLFFHPDAIREILVTKAKHFHRMPLPLKVLRQWNGDSVLMTEGDTWLRQRRILQPAFHQSRFPRYADEVTNAVNPIFDRFAASSTAIDFEASMTELTTAVVCRTMFGTDLSSHQQQIHRAVQVISKVAMQEMLSAVHLPDWLPLPGKREKRDAIATLDQSIRRIIRQRRESAQDRGDLLSMLLLAVDEEADGRGLTDEEVRDNCVTIFLAGHDTTAAGLTWLGWILASKPDIAKRASQEVASVCGDRLPTFSDLPQLSYLHRVIKETLRHYPPALAVFARQAIDEVEISGWTVPKGSIVRVITHTVQHDPRWYPDPERFDPDRFSPERFDQIPQQAYLPFGLGPRACIGSTFAMMEMTLVACMLIQRFRLVAAPGQETPELHPGLSLRPRGGLRLSLMSRR
jgi:cytochrome P450